MTKHNWKPGDVAIATVRGAPQVCVLRADFSTAMGQRKYGWLSCAAVEGTNFHTDAQVTEPRPLVVIDPEDREQVERLTKVLIEAAHADRNYVVSTNGIAPETTTAALREFANPTPPKPEEPTGLGAVVEDADGVTWVRVGGDCPWWMWEDVDDSHNGGHYADITAVRVLSEGVVQP